MTYTTARSIFEALDDKGQHTFMAAIAGALPGLAGVGIEQFIAAIDSSLRTAQAEMQDKAVVVVGVYRDSMVGHRELITLEPHKTLMQSVVEFNRGLKWAIGDELCNMQVYLPGDDTPIEVDDLPATHHAIDVVIDCVLEKLRPTPQVVFLKQTLSEFASTSAWGSEIDSRLCDLSRDKRGEEVYDIVHEGRTKTQTLKAFDSVISLMHQRQMVEAGSLLVSVPQELVSLYIARHLFEEFSGQI